MQRKQQRSYQSDDGLGQREEQSGSKTGWHILFNTVFIFELYEYTNSKREMF